MSQTLHRSVELPCELRSVTVARHLVRDLLLEWGLPGLVDDAQLGVSELVANAVRHAGTPLLLTADLDGALRIAVQDHHPELRRPSLGPQADAFRENGRGLQLVGAIAHDWGVRARADGKIIWFALRLPDGASPDADLYALDGYRTYAPGAAAQAASDDCPADGVGARTRPA